MRWPAPRATAARPFLLAVIAVAIVVASAALLSVPLLSLPHVTAEEGVPVPGNSDSDEFEDVHTENSAAAIQAPPPGKEDANIDIATDKEHDSNSDRDSNSGSEDANAASIFKAEAKTMRTTLHQIMIVLIPLYIITSINKYYPLLRTLFASKLKRSVPPSAQELIKFTNGDTIQRELTGEVQDFKIPVNSRVVAEKAAIDLESAYKLTYADAAAEILVISASAAVGVAGFACYAVATGTSMNFNSAAFYLCLLAIADTIRVLFMLLFSGGRDELFMNLSFLFLWFIVVLAVWLSGGHLIAWEGEAAYWAIEKSVQETVASSTLEKGGHISFAEYRFVKLLLSLLSGCFAVLIVFPSLRLARSQVAALIVHRESPAIVALLHVAFFSPLAVILLFLRPTAAAVTEGLQPHIPERFHGYLLVSLRTVAALFVVLTRAAMYNTHMQAYLDISQEKLAKIDDAHEVTMTQDASTGDAKSAKKKKQKKKAKEPKPEFISAGVVQRMVSNIWDYACVASLQVVLPNILILFSALLMVLRAAPDAVSPWSELGAGILWMSVLVVQVVNVLGLLFWQSISNGSGSGSS